MPTRPTRRAPAVAALALAGATLALPSPARAQAPPPAPPATPPQVQFPMAPQAPPNPGAFGPAQPQGYAYYPPTELPPWANPKRIDYEEGDPIPLGYELKTRPRKGLLITGLTIFGSAYAASLVLGSVAMSDDRDGDQFAPLLVPLAGPFVTIATADAKNSGLFWLMVDGVFQTGGVIMGAAAFATEELYLERTSPPPEARRRGSTPLLRPAVSIGPASAALRWRF